MKIVNNIIVWTLNIVILYSLNTDFLEHILMISHPCEFIETIALYYLKLCVFNYECIFITYVYFDLVNPDFGLYIF